MIAALPIFPSGPKDVPLVFQWHFFPRHHDDGKLIMLGNALRKGSQLHRYFVQQNIGWQSPRIPDDLLL